MRNNRLIVNGFSSVGAVRDNNEDNFFANSIINIEMLNEKKIRTSCYLDKARCFAVFDGVGGEAKGEEVSRCAAMQMEKLESLLSEGVDSISLKKAMSEYYKTFYDEIINLPNIIKNKSSCTAAIVVCDKDYFYPCWVGDSRIYLYSEGYLSLLTRDHTIAWDMIEDGELLEEEAIDTPAWHVLTRCMGQENSAITIGEPYKYKMYDKILICSDGISDLFSRSILERLMRLPSSLAVAYMKRQVRKKADDNSTVMILDVKMKNAVKEFLCVGGYEKI